MGRVSPHHPTGGLVERRKLPQWGPGGENGFYAYLRTLRSERSHLEHSFQYFSPMAGPPKCRGARENFPPFPACHKGRLFLTNLR